MTPPEQLPVTILIVEDDPGHSRLIEKNMRRAKIANEIKTFADGKQGCDYIFREGEYEGRPPCQLLVLLDLDLPFVDGYQILERMKQDPRTRSIPVVVLTSTDDEREVRRCYDLGCNVFIVKPVDYQRFSAAIQQLGLFLSVVKLPEGGGMTQ